MWNSMSENDHYQACQYSAPRSLRHENDFDDKENIQLCSEKEELSLYENPPLPLDGNSPKETILLGDYDSNSLDSGYIVNFNSENPSKSFNSNSMEDDFFEDFFDLEPLEESNDLPQDIDKLMKCTIPKKSNNLLNKSPSFRPVFRRALSLQNGQSTSVNNRVRSCLFKTNENEGGDAVRAFKRPEPPTSEHNSPVKKSKIFIDEENLIIKKPILQRTISATEESIMFAVQRSSVEPDLIGDFSKNFYLPLTQGRHADLKSITPNTLCDLIQGVFNRNVIEFKIIDCRYPYEYDGGHISGAMNIYTKEQCMELLNNRNCLIQDDDKRKILIFHCEFSSERGPNLCRYLRQQDRHLNQDDYPSLLYPEMYILEGGYKNFFEQFSQLCVPIAYKQMLHPEHENDLRFFRQKCKTWNVDTRQRPQRGNFKRLGL